MHQKPPIILLWYKRDLRINDHAPLFHASEESLKTGVPILAFYSFEPSVISAPDYSSFHRQCIEDSLVDLESSISRLSIPLRIFTREIDIVLDLLREKYDIQSIYSHEETGNMITYQRDISIGVYLGGNSIPWHEYPTNGVVRRLKTRDNWSKIWKDRMSAPLIASPTKRLKERFVPTIESDDWQTKGVRNSSIQKCGESEGHRVLDSFLTSRGKRYMGGMSRPIEGMTASSRISIFLAYGCISLKQAVQMTWQAISKHREAGDARFVRSLGMFVSRLHWQSHFIQKLESEPRFETKNAISLYDSIRQTYNSDIMDAIESGNTGIPFIDGVVRQLLSTGWVNFRARATLVSFVCNTCMQPWSGRWAHWLARNFSDYEPGIHYAQLQMQAGTMGINTIRIYNPTKQLLDKDTEGLFISRWLPELSHLPKHLQAEPWRVSEMESIEYGFVLGRDYPTPIVDIETANRKARVILYGMKKSIDPAEKAQVLEKHGSRKIPKKASKIPKKTPKKKIQKPADDSILTLF